MIGALTTRDVPFDKGGMKYRLRFEGEKVIEAQGGVQQVRADGMTVRNDQMNSQLDVYHSAGPFFVHSLRDLFPSPPPRFLEFFDAGRIVFTRAEEGGVWLAFRSTPNSDGSSAPLRVRYGLDLSTGAITDYRIYRDDDLIRQYGWRNPQAHGDGETLPSLSFETHYQNGVLTRCYVRLIDTVRLDAPVVAEAFRIPYRATDVIVNHKNATNPVVFRAVEPGEDVTTAAPPIGSLAPAPGTSHPGPSSVRYLLIFNLVVAGAVAALYYFAQRRKRRSPNKTPGKSV